MVPSRMVGGMSQSSSSGVFFQGDGVSQVAGNSQLVSTFGNPSNSLPGLARANTVPVSVGDLSNTAINSVANSGPSIGESSLVTGSNSGISGGPQFQRSISMNNESYMRLPTSPMSFSSNNISISGSSLIDGSSVVQQSSHQDQVSRQAQRNQQIQGATSVTSLPSPSQMGPVQLLGNSPRGSSTFMQDPVAISQLQKKPRLDIKQEDIMQQQVLKQLLQRQDSGHLQSPNPQLQALIQQQRRQQEQQLLQSMSPMQRVQFLQQQQQQQQQLQLRQRVQGMQQSAPGIKRPFDGGVCSRRLMQYLYHQRQRPVENAIAYWRKFVAEYYSPRAKKRWCLSQYDNAGNHSLGVFPQASQDPWQCDICGTKSGRGFEATFEVLPRLNEIKFGSGVIDELLFLDLPREYRFPTGMMVVEYAKAIQESVYEQLRVVREGQLRILFTPELKILSWEFCARRHEELLLRRVVTPQVNQLLQVAQKCQSTISESGPDGVSQQDLQANSAMVVAAGRQLAKSLELQSLNDLGFSKRYVRCLQIADVVNSMKDLIDFCREQKLGPIEGLKNFPRRTSEPKPQMQIAPEMDPTGNIHGLPTDHNTLNKLMSLHPGLNINNNHQLMANRGALSGSAALANYQNSLMRQNSMNSTHNIPVKQEPSSGLSTSSQAALANYQNSLVRQNSMNPTPNIPVKQEPSSGLSSSCQALPSSSTPGPSSGGVLQNTTLQQSSNSQAPSSQLKGSATVSVNGPQLQSQSLPSTQGGQALQQRMMQQLLQDMSRKGNTFSQQSPSLQNPSGNIVGGDGFAFRSSQATTNGPGNVGNIIPSRNNSFKSGSNGESHSSAAVGYNGFNTKSSDLSQNAHSSDAAMIDQDNSISQFADSFFDNDLDDSMNFSWKV